MTDPASELPAVLEEVFRRSAASRRLTALGAAGAAIAVAVGLIVFQWSPPLSTGEAQGVGIGMGLIAGALLGLGWAFGVDDPALVAFRDERLAWIFPRVESGGRQFLVLGTMSGVLVPLRLDRDGVQLTIPESDAIMSGLVHAHPWAHRGFSNEAQAKFQADARALAPSAPAGGSASLPTRKRKLGMLLGVAVLVGVAGSEAAKALDPTNRQLTARVQGVAVSGGKVVVTVQTIWDAEVVEPKTHTFARAEETGVAKLEVDLQKLDGAQALHLQVKGRTETIELEVPVP